MAAIHSKIVVCVISKTGSVIFIIFKAAGIIDYDY